VHNLFKRRAFSAKIVKNRRCPKSQPVESVECSNVAVGGVMHRWGEWNYLGHILLHIWPENVWIGKNTTLLKVSVFVVLDDRHKKSEKLDLKVQTREKELQICIKTWQDHSWLIFKRLERTFLWKRLQDFNTLDWVIKYVMFCRLNTRKPPVKSTS
jgi:hypothetical protein